MMLEHHQLEEHREAQRQDQLKEQVFSSHWRAVVQRR
jgi:hypothetical protein